MKFTEKKESAFLASFNTRSFRVGGYSIAATAMILVIAVAINLLVGALPASLVRFDITADGNFSISPQTEQLVSALDQDVTIYWIVGQDKEDTYVQNLLEQVDALSDRLSVVRKDTDLYPQFASDYTSETVYLNSLVVECGTRFRYLDAYTELFTYDYADYYTTGQATEYFNGEVALVSAIDYVTKETLPKLYFLTGHGEDTLSTTFSNALKNKNIESAELSLLKVDAVPEDADSILIHTPTSDISEAELKMLQDYAAAGGNILVMTDIYTGESKLKNLETLMADYGMHSVPGMVVETNRDNYFSLYQQAIQHALLPNMTSHAITDPLINGKYYVLFNGAHGIQVDAELAAELTVTQLLTTSDKAFSKKIGTSFENYNKEEGDIDGPFAVAALARKNAGAENESNVIWISSPTLVDDNANSYVSGGNQDLFLNMLTYLCEPEEGNYTIHAKTVTDTNFLTMDSSTSSMLAIWVVGIIPLTYMGWGVWAWFRRKRR